MGATEHHSGMTQRMASKGEKLEESRMYLTPADSVSEDITSTSEPSESHASLYRDESVSLHLPYTCCVLIEFTYSDR